MTKTIVVPNNESLAQYILSSAQGLSSVDVEEILFGSSHHITVRSQDNLGKEMIKRLIGSIERNYVSEDYYIVHF